MSWPSASFNNNDAWLPSKDEAVTPVEPETALIASLRLLKSVVVTVAVTVCALDVLPSSPIVKPTTPAALTPPNTACETAFASTPVFETCALTRSTIAFALALAAGLIALEPKYPFIVKLSSSPLQQLQQQQQFLDQHQ